MIAFDDRNSTTAGGRATHRAGLFDAFVLDCFAGGGGASLGIETGLRRRVNLSINHDPEAVAMHKANHPLSDHHCQDVHDADPARIIEQYGVKDFALAWFSPDCTYHSKARGGKPIRKKDSKRRDLAWVVIKWAKLPRNVRPRVIMLENVEEWLDWCPLDEDGKPCRRRKGQTFARWKKQLINLGYAVEFRMLRACDYGSPTIRKRLFLIARCDGQPIVWPEVTHGTGNELRNCEGRDRRSTRGKAIDPGYSEELLERASAIQSTGTARSVVRDRPTGKCPNQPDSLIPFRTAAECIDWSIPCPSIFLTREEAEAHRRRTGQRLIRPLKPATMKRIANGLKRYVIDAAEPFIVRVGHYSNLTGEGNHFRGQAATKPMSTITSTHDRGIVVPYVTRLTDCDAVNGCQAPKCTPSDFPSGCAEYDNNRHALVSAFLAKHYGGVVGHGVKQPVGTITSVDHHGLVAASMLRTDHTGTTGRGKYADSPDDPLKTIATTNGHAVAAAYLSHSYTSNTNGGRGQPDEPIKTILAGGNHAGLVAAFLQTYYSNGSGKTGRSVAEPIATIPTQDRHGLVQVQINGEPFIIADIGMRMLSPRELFRCQGFPDSYIIDPVVNGKALSKAAQVRMCGNSVCPQVAAALVRANFADELADEPEPVRRRPKAGGRQQRQAVEVA